MLHIYLLGFVAVILQIRARHLQSASTTLSTSHYIAAVNDSRKTTDMRLEQRRASIVNPQLSKHAFGDLTSVKWMDFPTSGFSFTHSAPKSTNALPSDTNNAAGKALGSQFDSNTDLLASHDDALKTMEEAGTQSEAKSQNDSHQIGPLCLGYSSLRSVLDSTFDSHVELIRRGIPSHTVKHFYNEALRYMTRNECFCSGYRSRISYACIFAAIFQYDEYQISSRLYHLIEIDRFRSLEHQKFPLYHQLASKPLPKLSSKENAAILLAKQYTVQNLVLVEANEAQDGSTIECVLPQSNELLYVGSDEDSLCDQFRTDQVGLPVTHYIAYAIGLAIQIRLSDVDDDEATKILNEATSNAFVLSQCERRDGNPGLIPFKMFQAHAEYFEPILTAALFPSVSSFLPATPTGYDIPKPMNFSIIIRSAYFFFERDIDYLSSIDSHGRPVVIQNIEHSVYIRRITTQITEEISMPFLVQVYNSGKRYWKFTGNSNNEASVYGEAVRCPSGWKYIPRMAPVVDVLENCCSPKCDVLGNVIYSYIVQSEICCNACNYKRCESATDDVIGTGEEVYKSEASSPTMTEERSVPDITMVSI
eukprot:TRINITY_DN78705_c0_g1_i1.p1 TRINITY_DN78705_c0_g1~~TRINITY_DN78705_c0_g1_i1.p1  ORF type:complete len:591 (-),score=50.95 TRINITY_DN78705_c0_g1_i1:142-1914(-)